MFIFKEKGINFKVLRIPRAALHSCAYYVLKNDDENVYWTLGLTIIQDMRIIFYLYYLYNQMYDEVPTRDTVTWY